MKKLKKRLLSMICAGAMAISALPFSALTASAAQEKYISEVFIAYGSTEDEAKNWLTSHGWEPVEGDFNAGKNDDYGVAAVMGVKRTSDPNDAITDMAVMNMGTENFMGYSFDDYQALLKEKKADIDEFVDCFMPAIREYRENYNGKGSEAGKARAQAAHDMLNKFYDGEIDGKYAINDTGMPLGDLFLTTTKRELGEDEYAALSKNEQIKYGDLQQIILESSAGAMTTVEQLLALASDSDEDTWLDRLEYMSGLSISEMAEFYADGSPSLGDSAAEALLMSKYGDAATALKDEADYLFQDLHRYEVLLDEHGIDPEADDGGTAFDAFMEQLQNDNEDEYIQVLSTGMLYSLLHSVQYEGDWGETLYDFLCPSDSISYTDEPADFLPLAVALSDGQRAGLEFLSLGSLLRIGVNAEDISVFPDLSEMLGAAKEVSVYSGINRAIFRGGVALTNAAMMEKAIGRSPYDQRWDSDSAASIAATAGLISGATILLSGVLIRAGSALYYHHAMNVIEKHINQLDLQLGAALLDDDAKVSVDVADKISETIDTRRVDYQTAYRRLGSISTAARWVMGIGGAMMVAAAVVKAVQLWKYYNRDFLPIPLYIVDEADLVSYTTDRSGNTVKRIDFNQYVYYEVVKCNRQDIGVNSKAQDGVAQYAEWGCGDAADLNCDIGKQWLALYTVKNTAKGDPILADSLTYQTGSDAMPNGCTAPLHFFTYSYAVDLGDTAYAYHNDLNGIYLFWSSDSSAFATASSFSTGQMALAGIGGLAVGILGASAVMLATKKRKDTPDATAVA